MMLQALVKVFASRILDTGTTWLEVNSTKDGILYFNKLTGEVTLEQPPDIASAIGAVSDVITLFFQQYDQDGSETLDNVTFWTALQTKELGLDLRPHELASLRQVRRPT